MSGPPKLLIRGPRIAGQEQILTPAALAFVADLAQHFEAERRRLLALRRERQAQLDAGVLPDFLPSTQAIRDGDWRVSPAPPALTDRRVEITGPVERKMVINALNSGAKMFMADFEDSTTPTFENLIAGQINLFDAVRGTIKYEAPDGRVYQLGPQTATLLVRPRGWHLPEAHALLDGEAISGSLFDFGLFVFHNAHEQIKRGVGPYFYLPKLESHLEARLWNQVINRAEDLLELPRGSVRVTVLIETILAAFEMDEILYELREHIVGLNCGRWDYIFSYIRAFARDPSRLLPDRAQVTMTTPFLRAYSRLLINTCHRRGAHAMGGMAAQIPIKHDPQANDAALAKVRADKEREVNDGHDGTWVAHPGLVALAMDVFDARMTSANQLERIDSTLHVGAADLLTASSGTITRAGVDGNVRVALEYLAHWIAGQGCVPIHNLMEDAATAEIARAQLWQWAHADGAATTEDGAPITVPGVLERIQWAHRELAALDAWVQRRKDLSEAADLLAELISAAEFPRFLTLPAYHRVLARENH